MAEGARLDWSTARAPAQDVPRRSARWDGRRGARIDAKFPCTTGGFRMANPDLRDWLAQMDAAGELQKVSGANRQEEIGGIVDIYQRATNRPALLFEDIPGYPKGYRVVANILTGVKRIAL